MTAVIIADTVNGRVVRRTERDAGGQVGRLASVGCGDVISEIKVGPRPVRLERPMTSQSPPPANAPTGPQEDGTGQAISRRFRGDSGDSYTLKNPGSRMGQPS